MHKRYWILSIIMILISGLSVVATTAQDTYPEQIDVAVQALADRENVDITIDDLTSFEWEARTFNTTALGCPQPEMVYNEVITEGYQLLLDYDGTTYDYRVSQNGGQVVLCDTFTNADNSQPPAQENPCGSQVTIIEGDTLIEIAERCNTTVNGIIAANDGLNAPDDTLFAGTVLNLPAQDTDTPFQDAMARHITIYPLNGQPGTTITITLNGFPANEAVDIGLGRPRSEYDILRTERTNAYGGLQTQLSIPEGSSLNETWVAVATLPESTDEIISSQFFVGGSDQTLFDQIDIYMVERNTGGQLGCGDTVRAVSVPVEPTIAPISAAYEALLSEDQQTVNGIYNALATSDLTLETATINDRTANIYLRGDLNIAGTCDSPRVQAQLQQTALQYSTVDDVNIYINDQPLQDILSAQN